MASYSEFLTDQDWYALGMGTTFEVYKKKEPLCVCHEPATEVFFTLDGIVNVLLKFKIDINKFNVNAKDAIKIPPRVCIGDVGVLFREKRSATCIPLEGESQILRIEEHIFRAILETIAWEMKNKRIALLSSARVFRGFKKDNLAIFT